MLADVVALLQVACERLHLDGLVFVPAGFHIAAYGRGLLSFLHPEAEARFDALEKLFAGLSLAEATTAVAEGRVVDAVSGEVVWWQPSPMVLAVSERLRDHLENRKVKAEAHNLVLRAKVSNSVSSESG